jgi:omega-hydroxypalmitate O-feruloyl transferase
MGMNNITEDLGVKFNKGPELLAAPQVSSNASDEEEEEEEVMFLSNINQVVLYPIETVYFYDVKDGGDGGGSSTLGVVDRLRDALLELLVPYSFMAGRLRYNKSLFRLELVLNNAGVLFGGAESSVTLAQVGNPNFPNPGFRDLALLPQNPTSLADLPLTTIQVKQFFTGSGFWVWYGL